ncbi:spinocerebellar ataxia type 10 protein domain-containing protein [Auriculariales sp. MPI-PUGE-AT-0066]|nr:spinocerebellar ataxia type 10 protein domain-containing protein [Auriculariales sp. MPI-PUGE-AT-0066]
MLTDHEPITPAQTTFLKLIDAFLHSNPNVYDAKSYAFLIPALRDLLLYAQASLRSSLGASVTAGNRSVVNVTRAAAPDAPPPPPPSTDARLPKVCEALVLIAQSLAALLLREHDLQASSSAPAPVQLKHQLLSVSDGTLELLIDVLRLFDAFLPRVGLHIVPGTDLSGFAYVKRDLVRVLGTLAHHDVSVQDRTNACGGIEVVLNLCVEDARNPYMREHAIFALHNLLRDHIANQRVVDELKLTGVEDTEGILRDVRRGSRV